MRKAILPAVGVLFFAGGIVVGVLSQRGNAPDENAPERDDAVASKNAVPVQPSLEADEQSLLGLWIQPHSPKGHPKILHFRRGYTPRECHVTVCDVLGNQRTVTIGVVLAEAGGKRQMLHFEDVDGADRPVVLFTYRLDSNALEVDRLVPANYGDTDHYDLGGKWFRLHYRQDAEPGAAPDPAGM